MPEALKCDLPHRSIEIISRFDIVSATQIILSELYRDMAVSTQPKNRSTLPKTHRNKRICERYADGESYSVLACVYGISEQRVAQIVKQHSK